MMKHVGLSLLDRLACLAVLGVVLPAWTTSVAAQEPEIANATLSYSRDVRPILARHCFTCHGPDEGTRESGLRLDTRDGALAEAESGLRAIVPADPDQSELVARITADDEFTRMPPESTKRELTAEEIATLRRWVAEGAHYEPHWAFTPPKPQLLPPVRDRDWSHNPIDRFILARLERVGLAPSPEADRRTLIRRVSLDLIGLPPTPEQVEAFVSDTRPDAYERLVESLLSSPRYGERWARRWLDLARYADTNGYEKDRPRSIWPYRDWVINSLNDDLPFDEFSIQQLAGDLLPEATDAQKVATGFHRNTMLNEEGGIDPLEFRYYSIVDRVATTGTTWLGLTLGCAQCHTHKYDPITHHEYFQFFAFLNNADEPSLELWDEDLRARRAAHQERIDALVADLPQRFPVDSVQYQPLRPVSVGTGSPERATIQDDGSVLFPPPGPLRGEVYLELLAPEPGATHLRLEALTHDSLPRGGPGRAENGNFVLSELQLSVPIAGREGHRRVINLVEAQADASQANFPVAHAIDGKPETGWAIDTGDGKLNTNRTATFRLEPPLDVPAGSPLRISLKQNYGSYHTLGHFRFSLGRAETLSGSDEERRQQALREAFDAWVKDQRNRAVRWQVLRPARAESEVPRLTIEPDHAVFVSGDMTKRDEYQLDFRDAPRGVRAIRLEALPDERLPDRGPGRVYYEGRAGDFFLSEITVESPEGPATWRSANHSFANTRFVSANAIDGDPQSGWAIAGEQGTRIVAVFELDEPLWTDNWTLRLLFERHYAAGLGRFRIAVTTDPRDDYPASDLDDEILALLHRPTETWSPDEQRRMYETFLLRTPQLAEAHKQLDRLRRSMPKPTLTLVMQERPADHTRPTFMHHRGEYLDPTEQVRPGVPVVLPPLDKQLPHNRLGLAKWMFQPDHPLTARVAVNRHWAAIFGTGLVATVDDFGLQGELPSHPELLDWLAVEFATTGWSVKQLHRLMVTSATYRQASRVTPELRQLDPQNRLLARGPRGRLEAEQIRDSVLAASGLLKHRLGGPSVFPPQPDSVTSEGLFGKFQWTTSTGDDRYRRTLYTFSKRTAPFAFSDTFDAPSGEACVARRDRSNTPLQALNLLNDPMFMEAAQALGGSFANRQGSLSDRMRQLFEQCLSRPPEPDELTVLMEFFQTQRRHLRSGQLNATALAGEGRGDPVERAAWTALARVILNLDEMVTRR